MKTDKKATIGLLLVGVNDYIANMAVEIASPTTVMRIESSGEFISFLEEPGPMYEIVVAGPLLEELDTIEVAQSLRGSLKDSIILFCHDRREKGFDHKKFVKNGFTDAFLLPFDLDEFRCTLERLIVKLKNIAVYRSVRVIDIQEDSPLDFDLYILLPTNRKYLRYSNAGHSVELSRLQRLKNYRVGSIFVPLDQMDKFYQYSASRLRALDSEKEVLAETERRNRLQFAVRNLMIGIFTTEEKSDFDEGKQVLDDAKEIIKTFIFQSDQAALYGQILNTIGDINDSYSHLSNVSTFAALFSIATGIGKPEELALAGLFHDLGFSIIPASIQERCPTQWTSEEREIYERHPEYSVNLVKDRKIVLPQDIQTMILQHHERIDGTGYPLGLTEPKLKQESQLLSIADEFDKLTCFEMGRRALSPEKALYQLKESGKFNPNIIDKLCQLFYDLAA